MQGQSNPVRLEDETYLKAGVVTAKYEPGEVVEFQVAVSTHHQGHYEFRICDKPLDAGSLISCRRGPGLLGPMVAAACSAIGLTAWSTILDETASLWTRSIRRDGTCRLRVHTPQLLGETLMTPWLQNIHPQQRCTA